MKEVCKETGELYTWCDDCETEFAEIRYKDKDWCASCFEIQLEYDTYNNCPIKDLDSHTTTTYTLEGEYLGDSDDFDSVIDYLNKHTHHVKKIQED